MKNGARHKQKGEMKSFTQLITEIFTSIKIKETAMKSNHVLKYLVFVFILISTANTAMSETGNRSSMQSIPDEFINLGADKFVSSIHTTPTNNAIQEIRNVTKIRHDRENLRLRITGVYDCITCDYPNKRTSIPAIEFVPEYADSGDYLGKNVIIKQVSINPGAAMEMVEKPCLVLEEWRLFELDLTFESPYDGYKESIFFDVKQMSGISRVILTVTWSDGIWDYNYTQ